MIDEIQQVRELAEAKLAEGKATGKIEAILAVLAARGVAVSAETRAHIEACKDPATVDRWIARFAVVASAEDVIGDAQKRA